MKHRQFFNLNHNILVYHVISSSRNDKDKGQKISIMASHRRTVEHVYANNPHLIEKALQHPNVKSAQKTLENATIEMEQNAKCMPKIQPNMNNPKK